MDVFSGNGLVIYGRSGEPLNARCSVSASLLRLAVHLESAGGTKADSPRKNADYGLGLVAILERAAKSAAQLLDVYLDAQTADVQSAPMADRRLDLSPFDYPVSLAPSDVALLAPLIRERQRGLVRKEGAKGAGNSERSVALVFGWEAVPKGVAPADLSAALVAGADAEHWSRFSAGAVLLRASSGPSPEQQPTGRRGVPRQPMTTFGYPRDPEVVAWVLARAHGRCELCGASAPFERMSGEPFLEVHHVRPLSDGGSDTVTNASGLCPNCHRRCHHSHDRREATSELIRRIDELRAE